MTNKAALRLVKQHATRNGLVSRFHYPAIILLAIRYIKMIHFFDGEGEEEKKDEADAPAEPKAE